MGLMDGFYIENDPAWQPIIRAGQERAAAAAAEVNPHEVALYGARTDDEIPTTDAA